MGKLLVYCAARFRGRYGCFTAVSRPPWFTALAFWPDGETYGGGGFFQSNRTLVLRYLNPSSPLESTPVPPHLSVRGMLMGENEHDGWLQQQVGRDAPPAKEMRVVYSPPWPSIKVHPGASVARAAAKLARHVRSQRPPARAQLCRVRRRRAARPRASRLGGLSPRRVAAVREGRLYRTKSNDTEREVADLRSLRFRAIVSRPEARQWRQQ